MRRVKSVLVLLLPFIATVALVGSTSAQPPGGGRGPGMARFGSLLGLMGSEQVQKELKLSEEQVTKVGEMSEKLRGEMREQFGSLRDIQDRDQLRAKMRELMNESDRNAREQLREVLNGDQMRRLFQIRLQVRAVAESLASEWLANRLQITPEQKEKLEQITQDTQAKQMALFGEMRDASEEQRNELRQKFSSLRTEADEKALAVLTAEQKGSFQEMQGEKFVLETGGPQ
jgi:Spy/CpxP family protein refolding chaperone